MIETAIAWATAEGPPNWLFLLAVLTHPSRWTEVAITAVRERIGSQE